MLSQTPCRDNRREIMSSFFGNYRAQIVVGGSVTQSFGILSLSSARILLLVTRQGPSKLSGFKQFAESFVWETAEIESASESFSSAEEGQRCCGEAHGISCFRCVQCAVQGGRQQNLSSIALSFGHSPVFLSLCSSRGFFAGLPLPNTFCGCVRSSSRGDRLSHETLATPNTGSSSSKNQLTWTKNCQQSLVCTSKYVPSRPVWVLGFSDELWSAVSNAPPNLANSVQHFDTTKALTRHPMSPNSADGFAQYGRRNYGHVAADPHRPTLVFKFRKWTLKWPHAPDINIVDEDAEGVSLHLLPLSSACPGS